MLSTFLAFRHPISESKYTRRSSKNKLFPGRAPSLNLRGKDDDERGGKRLSCTSIKVRFSEAEDSDLPSEYAMGDKPSMSTSGLTMEVSEFPEVAPNSQENKIHRR